MPADQMVDMGHTVVIARLKALPVGAILIGAMAVLHSDLPDSWHRPWTAGMIAGGIAAIAWGVRRNRQPKGSGWYRFAVAIACYSASDLLFLAISATLGPDHIAGTIVWLCGLAALPYGVGGLREVFASGDRAHDLEARLDSAVVALAVAYVGWYSVVVPQVHRDGWSSYGVVGSTALWVVAVAVLGFVLSRGLAGGGSVSLWLFAAAIPLTVMSSIVYWTLEQDHLWASAPTARLLGGLAYATAAAAVWHPSMTWIARPPRHDGPVLMRLLLVGTAAAVVPLWHLIGVITPVSIPPPNLAGSLIGVAVTTAALARVVVTLRTRDQAQRSLVEREARFRSLVQHAHDHIVVVDADMRLTWGSTNAGGITGRLVDDLYGASVLEEVVEEDQPVFRDAFERCLSRPRGRVRGRVRLVTTAGEARWIEYSLVNQLDNPAVHGVVVNYHDVTTQVQTQDALAHQATHDVLTGLPNRANLRQQLELACEDPHGRPAVLFLDLDRFKLVNDSLGHQVGDRLLSVVADRIRHVVRTSDVVARIGGDEFVVLCRAVSRRAEALSLASRICSALADPVEVDGHELSATASIGVAIRADGESPGELLRDADTAMYQAKEQGRNGYVLFDQAWRGASASRLQLEAKLRRALSSDGLTLHYQPIAETGSGRMVAVEALLRWADDDAGSAIRRASPEEMIAVAEESGLIGPLGEWVLARACHDLAVLDELAPGRSLRVCVNVSGAQLRRGGFERAVATSLGAASLTPDRLTLELTESVVVEDVPIARATLSALVSQGVRLAMDDFGTGYSALANLKRLPLSMVKIDRSFVDGVVDEPEDAAIVQAVVGMARALGLQVVAEGVESDDHLVALAEAGCDLVQGYHLGRPMPLADLASRLAYTTGPHEPTDPIRLAGVVLGD